MKPIHSIPQNQNLSQEFHTGSLNNYSTATVGFSTVICSLHREAFFFLSFILFPLWHQRNWAPDWISCNISNSPYVCAEQEHIKEGAAHSSFSFPLTPPRAFHRLSKEILFVLVVLQGRRQRTLLESGMIFQQHVVALSLAQSAEVIPGGQSGNNSCYGDDVDHLRLRKSVVPVSTVTCH